MSKQSVNDQTFMNLTSAAFSAEEAIPTKYTCDGENVSPSLRIEDVPQGTRSLALIVEDPDAPGGTFTHWTVWNVSPDVAEIAENSVPAGAVQGRTGFGGQGYGGPCPPSGTHRYYFRLYALNTELALSPEANAEQLREAMEGAVVEETEVMGTYAR